MARVTVEDCIEKIPNRFDLVIAAAQRSREISNGMPIEIERDNDKNPVVSLREIACDAVDAESLHERFIRSMQKNQLMKIKIQKRNCLLKKNLQHILMSLKLLILEIKLFFQSQY